MTQQPVALPFGGPLKIDPAVAGAFLAHVQVICAEEGSEAETAAVRRRNHLLREMGPTQRDYVLLIADTMIRLVTESA